MNEALYIVWRCFLRFYDFDYVLLEHCGALERITTRAFVYMLGEGHGQYTTVPVKKLVQNKFCPERTMYKHVLCVFAHFSFD